MDDYIIREDAYMALTGDITDCTIEEYIARLREKLSKLPTVTPKEKTGKWVNEKWYGLDFIGVTCSNCGIIESRFSPYCPNCGVKMIKPQESEEEK